MVPVILHPKNLLHQKHTIQLGVVLPVLLVPVECSKTTLLKLLMVQCWGFVILVICTEKS